MITPEQSLKELVEKLRDFEPGVLPYPLFMEIARLSTLSTIELVPIRADSGDRPEVLLTQRPDGDPWEGQWHVPGTVLLPTDRIEHTHDYRDAFARLLGKNGELKSGVKMAGEPVEVHTERRKSRRGAELSVVHYVPVVGEPEVGGYFSMDDFPHNVPSRGVIEHHVPMIQKAVKRYISDTRQESR